MNNLFESQVNIKYCVFIFKIRAENEKFYSLVISLGKLIEFSQIELIILQGKFMQWLESVISKSCEKRSISFSSKIYTVTNYFLRTWSSDNVKKRAYEELVSIDISTSADLQTYIEEACEKVTDKELSKGKLALKLHISTMESRNSYLVLLAALIATLAVAIRLLGAVEVALGMIMVGLPLVMTERSKVTERKYQLEELLIYIEHFEDSREPEE